MRNVLLASATMLALAAAPAFAQTPPNTPDGARPGNVIGTNNSLPTSDNASNIRRSDTRSPIAPRLPSTPLGQNGTSVQYLTAAKTALQRHRTGEAQEALEQAETRLLDRSTPQGADPLDVNPRVRQIRSAREALGAGDLAHAGQIIDTLISSPS
jgi:hypothetical protein